jgi:transglutaminase-like putative cysteine protease
MKEYLKPAFYIDSDHEGIIALANSILNADSVQEDSTESNTVKAIKLYLHVRDAYFYDPYKIDLRDDTLKASHLLTRSYGYCGEKACLLAALGRASGIPSRLAFARVTNHIGTSKLEELLKSNELVFHGTTEFYLNEKWVKCTPAFNSGLCDKLGVEPLDFNGVDDSIFQEFNKGGGKYMEYTHDYGSFADLPKDLMMSELEKFYPHVFELKGIRTPEAYFIID